MRTALHASRAVQYARFEVGPGCRLYVQVPLRPTQYGGEAHRGLSDDVLVQREGIVEAYEVGFDSAEALERRVVGMLKAK